MTFIGHVAPQSSLPYHQQDNFSDPAASVLLNNEGAAMSGRASHADDRVSPAPELVVHSDNPNSPDQINLLTKPSPLLGDILDRPRGQTEGRRQNATTQTSPVRALQERPRPKRRILFEEFATQIRVHRHHENKLRLLKTRQDSLRKAVALSLRLLRIASLVQDGLVELSRHTDKAGFVRIHQLVHDLVDTFNSHWKRDLDNIDPSLDLDISHSDPQPRAISFLPKLSAGSKAEFFSLLDSLRSDSQFLIERIKSLSPSQLAALATSTRPRDAPGSALSSFQGRTRHSQKRRNEAYSYGLEDYALSFERSSPLSFLIFNVFGRELDLPPSENAQRLQTWSAVFAALYLESEQKYHGLFLQVLNSFATLSSWRAKDRLELFLMDILQRGAFLLDLAQGTPVSLFPESPHSGMANPFGTQESEEFFDDAVLELFAILSDSDGGIPDGALQLVRAVLGRMESIDDQSRFRGYLFYRWFLHEFLRIIITFPENENMLLQCHISKSARDNILHHLWRRADSVVYDLLNGSNSARPVHPALSIFVHRMIGQLERTEMSENAYGAHPHDARTHQDSKMNHSGPVLLVSPSDIVQIIDSLCPPPTVTLENWDPFISSSTYAFNAQYSHATTKLDKLRREISLLAGLGPNVPLPHPCQESWTLLHISRDGKSHEYDVASSNIVMFETGESTSPLQGVVHKAAMRLVDDYRSPFGTPRSPLPNNPLRSSEPCLEDYFREEIRRSRDRAEGVAALYWHTALKSLLGEHQLSVLTGDDTRILEPIIEEFQVTHQRRMQLEQNLESDTVELKDTLNRIRESINQAMKRSDRLRVKMWYGIDVVHSNIYEDAKHITFALNNMAISTPEDVMLDHISLVGRGRTLPSSSFLEQPRTDTVNILKAPKEYGGPKKLADTQLEATRKWLQRNSVDNFCKGEERIHRFCMEIKGAAKGLVGEFLSDSPVLWSSELFAKEKARYDNTTATSTAAHTNTRPPSVISETYSSTAQLTRLGYRGFDTGLRSQGIETHSSLGRKGSFHSLGSTKIPKEYFGADRSSSGSSPGGRAVSATTADSLNSLWSPLPPYTHSVTSASIRSRPASTYNDVENAKVADQSARDKVKFLETLQQELICLLLSDLGCPVWSCGSETDAWLQKIYGDNMIQLRIKQRRGIEKLVSNSQFNSRESRSKVKYRTKHRSNRSSSAAPGVSYQTMGLLTEPTPLPLPPTMTENSIDQYCYPRAYQDLLEKLSQEVDPMRKLGALHDFKQLALLQARQSTVPVGAFSALDTRQTTSLPGSRRSSFDPRATGNIGLFRSRPGSPQTPLVEEPVEAEEPSEGEVIQLLRGLLLTLKPKTLFRDLQYISAFVSSDTLNETESGRAFLHFGLAALAYKDEICRSMVEVADKVISKDLIKRKAPESGTAPEHSLLNVAEFWIFAAREGNAIAQRELASLYLTCPEPLPVVSLPLSLSAETFKSEMMWDRPQGDGRISPQKLCLALHWMQHAAVNGDAVAKQKLKEREERHSIR